MKNNGVINKNDEYEIEIIDIADDGMGIGKIFDKKISGNVRDETKSDEKAPGKHEHSSLADAIKSIEKRSDVENKKNIENKPSGFTVFVKDAVPGDVVKIKILKVKKAYGYGKIIKIIKPSRERVKPVCPIATKCGGCSLQSLSYEKQLYYKERKVKNLINRIGGITDFEMMSIIGMDDPKNYRNKAQFPVSKNSEGKMVSGFYAGRTHSVVDIIPLYKDDALKTKYKKNNTRYDEKNKAGLINKDEKIKLTPLENAEKKASGCLIQSREINIVFKIITDILKKHRISIYNENKNTGFLRHIMIRSSNFENRVMICFVANGKKIPHENEIVNEILKRIKKHNKNIDDLNKKIIIEGICLNINKKNTNAIMGDKTRVLYGKPYLTDTIGDLKFKISPLSFFQVNKIQTKKLYDTAMEFAGLKDDDTVWDLYCGIGTISLYAAKHAKHVIGVEIIPDAIRDAKENAKINGIENAEFLVGKAEDVAKIISKKPDVVIVDPPRKGCDKSLIDCIIKNAPKKIVYVSCDPATLSRDLKIFSENGYKLKSVRPVDMFPHTSHVESVSLIVREK